MPRPPRLHHCTSEPFAFFGRAAELGVLDAALGGGASVVALVGPGGQGKTAIVRHWLERALGGPRPPDGAFLWSFYRGQDADLCLRELYAYAEGLPAAPDVSATYCVDRLLPLLRRERWAVVLDGAEVAQHEGGPEPGRFLHPELGRLLEELASAPLPGVVALTTRFALPTLSRRPFASLLSLSSLDAASARALLGSLGVRGTAEALDAVAAAGGRHAKAVELLGTFLVRFHGGEAARLGELPAFGDDEEARVAGVLGAFAQALPQEARDALALATAFRDPPAEGRLLEYLASAPVRALLHQTWGRSYTPFAERPRSWLSGLVGELVGLRLLERVGLGGAPVIDAGSAPGGGPASAVAAGCQPAAQQAQAGSPCYDRGEAVIDAHPLVRRAFDGALGAASRREGSGARAGFLRGRPGRRRPDTLAEAREEVELFHAYCDAGLWDEADGALVALENPKHRFLAPALERDLLLRFFPGRDWRRPPRWPGFGRWRSLAICFEMLGAFDDALEAYRPADAALRGDALLARGRLGPLLGQEEAPPPWQPLWRAYRCHALALAGRAGEALALARSLVPVDVYEWAHVFECLLRCGALSAFDLNSALFRAPGAGGHAWAELARRRLRADYRRVTAPGADDLDGEYRSLLEEYDRAGLPLERALTRLGFAAWLRGRGRRGEAREVNAVALGLARQYGMRVVEADAWEAALDGDATARAAAAAVRRAAGYHAPPRP